MSGTTLLRIRDLRRTYRDRTAAVEALRGCDLDVAAGSFIAVMGRSGCGKSTLLHLIGGLDRPDGGSLEMDGIRYDAFPERQMCGFRRQNIGMVFQFFNLIPELTLRENIYFPALLARQTIDRPYIGSLLDSLNMVSSLDRIPSRCSGGEQQRAALVRAVVLKPKLILLDEPTGNLDRHSSEQVLASLKVIRRSTDCAMILVTHDPMVAGSADHICHMSDGRIEQTVPRDQAGNGTAPQNLGELRGDRHEPG